MSPLGEESGNTLQRQKKGPWNLGGREKGKGMWGEDGSGKAQACSRKGEGPYCLS